MTNKEWQEYLKQNRQLAEFLEAMASRKQSKQENLARLEEIVEEMQALTGEMEELLKEIDPFYYKKASQYALTHLKQMLGMEEDYWDITLKSIIDEMKEDEGD